MQKLDEIEFTHDDAPTPAANPHLHISLKRGQHPVHPINRAKPIHTPNWTWTGWVKKLIEKHCLVQTEKNFVGENLSNMPIKAVATIEQCSAQCYNKPGCEFFVLIRKKHECWLKKNFKSNNYGKGLTSGFRCGQCSKSVASNELSPLLRKSKRKPELQGNLTWI